MVATNKILGFVTASFIAIVLIAIYFILTTNNASALSCNNCVNGGDVVNNSLTASDLGPNSVNASELNNNSVDIGAMLNNSVGSLEIVDNAVTSADLAADIEVTTLTADTIVVSNLFNTDFLNLGNAVVLTIPDDGSGATAASATLDQASSWAYIGLNCEDANGCDLALGQDFVDGDVMVIYNEGTNAVNFSDTAGASELAGNFTMGEFDTLELIFRKKNGTDSWLEVSRSNN